MLHLVCICKQLSSDTVDSTGVRTSWTVGLFESLPSTMNKMFFQGWMPRNKRIITALKTSHRSNDLWMGFKLLTLAIKLGSETDYERARITDRKGCVHSYAFSHAEQWREKPQVFYSENHYYYYYY